MPTAATPRFIWANFAIDSGTDLQYDRSGNPTDDWEEIILTAPTTTFICRTFSSPTPPCTTAAKKVFWNEENTDRLSIWPSKKHEKVDYEVTRVFLFDGYSDYRIDLDMNSSLPGRNGMMRIKKLLLLLLTAAALLLPAGCGEDPDAWETPASDFTYEIVDGGVRITAYTGSLAWVRIPAAIDGAPVVAIGEKAFFRAGITELSIPESVTEIGRSAFTGNEKLCTVEMQNDPAREGGLVYFGGLFWRVLEWNADENRALVLSEDILEVRPYHSEWTAMTWKECDLRAYLNGEFLENTFTEEERARIRLGNVNTPYRTTETPAGGITKTAFSLLSADEAAAYFPDDASRAACLRSGEPCWWWLRSPGTYKVMFRMCSFRAISSATTR